LASNLSAKGFHKQRDMPATREDAGIVHATRADDAPIGAHRHRGFGEGFPIDGRSRVAVARKKVIYDTLRGPGRPIRKITSDRQTLSSVNDLPASALRALGFQECEKLRMPLRTLKRRRRSEKEHVLELGRNTDDTVLKVRA
jgi:hypothetical protein